MFTSHISMVIFSILSIQDYLFLKTLYSLLKGRKTMINITPQPLVVIFWEDTNSNFDKVEKQTILIFVTEQN